jgi:hypothetical protein
VVVGAGVEVSVGWEVAVDGGKGMSVTAATATGATISAGRALLVDGASATGSLRQAIKKIKTTMLIDHLAMVLDRSTILVINYSIASSP